ncbi:uncharacterized protein LOC111295144 isoform X2 [Durio zibethinus]|uniref:Uncharacterized protein LOC111295144 isoform X2 n=1 Tax=Durio zibethinus TaxID=66656 RepID=A0A6P5YVV6_DURZI|nr:uncharacterized protein LOC111295144 isoform X2 [Durio zibethinus]
MSPSTVEIRSMDTFSSNAKPYSAPQNPNATPKNFTAFPQTNHSHMNSSSSTSSSSSSAPISSTFGNGREFDCGFDFSSWSSKHPKSAASVRPRPRLVKRKQLNGKVRTGQSEVGSGFNPFKQSGQESGRINNSGNLSSSGFLDSLNIVNNDNINNNNDNSNNLRFVFGANHGSDRESSGNVKVESGNEKPFREFEKADFVFETDLRCDMEKLGSEKCGKFGFVLGANGSDGGAKLNPGKGESCDFGVSLDGSRGEMKVESGAQGSKDSNLEFTSGLNKSDLASNLDSGKGDFCETLKKPDFNDAGFVFGSSRSDLKSTFDSNKIEPTNVVGGSSSMFGANHLNSFSFNLERRESGKNFGQSVSGELGKMNMKGESESQNMESTVNFNAYGSKSWIGDFANGFFVFGATSSKDSFPNECKDGINSSSENFGVSASNDWRKDASENSINIGSSSSANSIFKMEHDLQKLNISCDKNVGGTYTTEDSNTKANLETIFVFGSNEKASSHLKKAPESGHSDNKSSNGHTKDDVELNGTDACSMLNLNSQGNCHVIDEASVGTERNNESCSTSTLDQSGISFGDLKIPEWDLSFFKANMFPEVDMKLEFGVKSGLIKEKMLKKMRGKSKKSYLHKHCSKQHHVPKESSSQENQDSSECYSPMDFSPYQETTAADQSSKETAQASEVASPLEYNFISSAFHSSILTMPEAECTSTAQKGSDSNEGDQKCGEQNEEKFGDDHESIFVGDGPSRESVCEAETAFTTFKSDWYCTSGAANVGGAEGLNGAHENKHTTQSCFSSGLEDERNFTFSAMSTSGQGSSSFRKHQLRKKSKVKIGNASFIITPSPDVRGSSSVQFSPCDPVKCEQKDESTYHSKEENEQCKQESNSSTAAVQEACEMWRLRGNQAYRNDNLSKAEDFYTQGINSVPSNETSLCSIKPLVLCYSNRAATRMSLGRMREALADCLMAAGLDPNFLKVYVRAANCHLLLGEIGNAVRHFTKCLGSGADVCLDRRITIDAADGVQKAQRVNELTNRSAILLEQKSSSAASSALDTIAEALSISSYSEKLLEMKAEALFTLRKYEEAIQLCEQSLYVAEQNFPKAETDNQLASIDGSGCYSIAMLWRWHLMSKSYFYMGKLEKALDLLHKLEQVGSMKDNHGSHILEMSVSLAVTIRELLRLKNSGNEAVRSVRYTEAVEHYTIALSSNVESRPFAAICFCNRAAAQQALGQIADAIADCSLAMALDENYTKAVSRRATLHEMIRDYGQASSDLQRLISILEKQADKKSHQSAAQDGSTGNSKELRLAQRQLSSMQEDAKGSVPLDLYLILGVKPSDSTSDVKKAYRKAALRHHPDKAGQFLARSESGDEGRLWKEIAEEVHKDADRLFKIIGEAYAVLSDAAKRSEYDLEEENRKTHKESKSNPYERSQYERNSSRRYWRGNSKEYRNSHSRWWEA